MNPRYVVCV